MNKFNEAFVSALQEAGITFRSPSYKYYGGLDRYFWTTQKINHKGSQKYVAGIYRYLKSKDQLKLVKRVGFAKKAKAKEWARKAHEEKK